MSQSGDSTQIEESTLRYMKQLCHSQSSNRNISKLKYGIQPHHHFTKRIASQRTASVVVWPAQLLACP